MTNTAATIATVRLAIDQNNMRARSPRNNGCRGDGRAASGGSVVGADPRDDAAS